MKFFVVSDTHSYFDEMIDLKKDLPNKSWKKYYELAKILQK